MDRCRAPTGGWLVLAALAAALLTGCQSDLLSFPSFDSTEPGTKRSAAEELPLGSWKRDSLHCAEGRCERWYEIEVEEDGTLRVDLYAPVGRGLPDCEMQLETEDGDLVAAHIGRVQARRRLRHQTGPATYRLLIASKGSNRDLFDFEVVAEVGSGAQQAGKTSEPATRKPRPKPVQRPARKKRPDIPRATVSPGDGEPGSHEESRQAETKTTPDEIRDAAREEPAARPEAMPGPELTPIPEPPAIAEITEPPAIAEPRWVIAEVLDVEETDGEVSAVMVEAGAPDGIKPGMQGELFEGDTAIGDIEIVDVYETGSRARILGALSAPVNFDTLSRIAIPPDGE